MTTRQLALIAAKHMVFRPSRMFVSQKCDSADAQDRVINDIKIGNISQFSSQETSTVAFHWSPIPLNPCTNAFRSAEKRWRDRQRNFTQTPLVKAGTACRIHGIGGVPMELLLSVFGHVEQRLDRLGRQVTSGRIRKQERWLGKWQQRITAEIERRRTVCVAT